MKDTALTLGDLSYYELDREKSAEVILTNSNELCIDSMEVSQVSEGLNIMLFQIN